MQTFTQPKIVGYRQLSEAEAELMNFIKDRGAILDQLLSRVGSHVAKQRDTARVTEIPGEQARIDFAQPERWAAIARTHFQEGLMALTRAVAQPSSF
jgi:hypothetical protein